MATNDTRDTVSFVVNDDGTINITTSSATTSSSNAYVIGTFVPSKTGQYIVSTGLSSAATGGSESTTFCVQIRQGMASSSTLIARIGSDPATVTLTAGQTYTLRFYFLSGQTINEICEPMIRPAEITDDTFQPYAKTNVDLTNENANQQLEIDYSINTGAKNLLKNVRATTTNRGITFTVNEDGSVIANGTNDGTGASLLNINTQSSLALDNGEYILSGCPTGGSTTGYMMDVTRSTGASLKDIGDGVSFMIGEDYTVNEFRIVISRNLTVDNLTFYPMIRHAEITDNSYEPYAPANRELYETKTEQTETNVIANLGAKNMLYISNSPGYITTSHGRTFTVLSDGGIKITGASSDSSNADFYIIGSWGNRSILLNENRDSCLMLMKCDTDYGYNQIRLRAMNRSTGSTVNETGVETNKDVRLSHIITTVFISVFPSVTLPVDGVVVYPMIRRAEITDNTFQPYAPTNRELYEMILALQSGRSLQSVNPTSTLNLSRNDLNESLDTGLDPLDSIPEEESESYNIDEELTEEEESE